MTEIVNAFVLLIAFLVGRAIDPDPAECPGGVCVDAPGLPIATWVAPRSLAPAEVRLWSRGERRPGQPEPEEQASWLGPRARCELQGWGDDRGERRIWIVLPARERLAAGSGPLLAMRARR